MIDGYWTALATIMLLILLMTGWGKWLHKQLNLIILFPSILILWITAREEWNLHFSIGEASLTLNASYALIGLILCGYQLNIRPQLEIKLIMLYTIVMALALAMIRALMMLSPWAEAAFAHWQLPIISGVLLGLLQLTLTESLLILFIGAGLTELLLVWQQRREYSGMVASLQWWDFFVLTFASIVMMKLLLGVLQKGKQSIVQMLSNRMKN